MEGVESEPLADAFRAAHDAMAATFQITIAGADARYAAQAAAAAFERIDAIEGELSRFIPSSDTARLNRQAPGAPLRIGAATVECLALAARIGAETGGAFDAAAGALIELWNRGAPSAEELAAARAAAGSHLLSLDPEAHTATAAVAGLRVDLGGIGKGSAADAAAALLADWGLAHALVNAGGSSLRATGAPPNSPGWPLFFPHPAGGGRRLGALRFADGGVSGSGVKKGAHIIDPRTGVPAAGTRAAWAAAPTAAEADALSTAFMVMAPGEVERFCAGRADIAALLLAGPADAEIEGTYRFGAFFGNIL